MQTFELTAGPLVVTAFTMLGMKRDRTYVHSIGDSTVREEEKEGPSVKLGNGWNLFPSPENMASALAREELNASGEAVELSFSSAFTCRKNEINTCHNT